MTRCCFQSVRSTSAGRAFSTALIVCQFCWPLIAAPFGAFHTNGFQDGVGECLPTPDEQLAKGTVTELIAAKYQRRYSTWKEEYLSTEAGQQQWRRFALNPDFVLTITVSRDEGEGARVDGRWDSAGRLVAASMTLGTKLETGYPSSFNYPVTCSLAPGNLPREVKGKILAATKLAHEFGHLNLMMNIDGRVYELQNRLMLEYNRIFYSNGYNTLDPRLVELEKRMGGTSVSIAQEREHWAEMGAIQYLRERLSGGSHHAKMPREIKEAIEAYYSAYPGRM
jgi:hypothetical protein